ncbi:MAG: hypothetical protein LIP08_10475 [Bacteroides sp.]|nr:hypothetical protein [Bacteroides sp.]
MYLGFSGSSDLQQRPHQAPPGPLLQAVGRKIRIESQHVAPLHLFGSDVPGSLFHLLHTCVLTPLNYFFFQGHQGQQMFHSFFHRLRRIQIERILLNL